MRCDTQTARSGMTNPAVLGCAVAGTLIVCLFYSYWPVLTGLWATWQGSPDYSAGQLVPVVTVCLLWSRRRALAQIPIKPCWWGLIVLVVAQAARAFGTLLTYGSIEQLALWLTIVGGVWTVLGTRFTRQVLWLLLFMTLMFPLPRRMHEMVALPLQEFATASAVYGLEILGHLVIREGNVLRPSEQTSVAIAEACNGLRMLTAFVMVAATIAFLTHRPRWQKAVLVLSSVPIAVLTNTIRLIVTVILCEATSSKFAEKVFHDFAGLTMMPFAIIVLVGELWIMRLLTRSAPVDTGSSGRGTPPQDRRIVLPA
jgi:exosortase